MEDIRNANSEDPNVEGESELEEAHELRRAYRAQLKARHPHLYYKPYEQVEESLDITAELPSELNPGRYEYYCLGHPYMTGTTIVE